MNPGTAHRMVLLSAVGVFGIGWFNSAKKGHTLPSKKFLVGCGISFTVLSFLSDVQPDLAAAFSGAMLTTVAFNEGGGILKYMNGKGEVTTPDPNIRKSTRETLNHLSRVSPATIGQVPGLPVLTAHPQTHK